MRKNPFFKTLAATLAAMVLLTACGTGNQSNGADAAKSTSAPAETQSDKSKNESGEKKSFIIYNTAGAPGYHEQVVLEKFKAEFGDKYDIQYETIGGFDAITKVESQGLKQGDGNVNIMMMGDSHLPKALETGILSDLSVEEETLKMSDYTDMARAMYEAYDKSVVPISIEPNQAAIAYMPGSEVGARLDAVVGEDGGISYDELKAFMVNDPKKPVMGRGLFSNSGPGDIWTFGLMMEKDKYGEDTVPQNSIDWAKDLYANGQIALYEGTSATFKDMTDGNIDLVPHSLSWFFRLYALKKAEATLPEQLKVDAVGLENAKFAFMTDAAGQPLDAIIAGHYYVIPANLSAEDYAASMEFMTWVTQPEINAEVLTVLTAPTFKSATPDLIKDPLVLQVWGEVEKYYPQQFLEESGGMKVIKTTNRKYRMSITDVGVFNTYTTAWRDQLEAIVK